MSLRTLRGSSGETAAEAKEEEEEVEAELQGKSVLWGNWTETSVKDATLLWIEQVVIGMKLCPFAMEAMGGLRVAVSEAEDFNMALDKFDVELKWLVGLDKEYACTMIVYPPALFDSPEEEGVAMKKNETCEVENEYVEDIEPGDKDCSVPGGCSNFEKFMSLAKQQSDMAQYLNAARGQDIESETLLLTFHPNSQFGDVDDDPADFALRSPFPTVLILRGSDVREAEDVCEQQGRVTEDIAIANEARLRQVGYAELQAALDNIWTAAREGRSTEMLEAAQEEREAALEQARLAALAEAGELRSEEGYDGWDGIDGMDVTAVKPVEIQDGNLDYAGLDGRLGAQRASEAAAAEAVLGPAEVAKEIIEPFDPFGYEPEISAEMAAEAEAKGEAKGEEAEPAKEIIEPFDPFGYEPYAVTEEDLRAQGPLLDEDETIGGGGNNKGDRI